MIRRLLIAMAFLPLSNHASALLYCNNNLNQQVEWTVGHQVPYVDTYNTALYCWANGAELAYIRAKFSNVRMTTYPLVYWIGEDAIFIYDNLEDEAG